LSVGSGVAPPHEKDPLRRVFVIQGDIERDPATQMVIVFSIVLTGSSRRAEVDRPLPGGKS